VFSLTGRERYGDGKSKSGSISAIDILRPVLEYLEYLANRLFNGRTNVTFI
jgi:hypothetical protein